MVANHSHCPLTLGPSSFFCDFGQFEGIKGLLSSLYGTVDFRFKDQSRNSSISSILNQKFVYENMSNFINIMHILSTR